ncbi:hypothetical protein DUNSADRAFT_12154 [Dunaliella salina]|uniref:RRM domain-containing protein n=1 Tax=Dunaliella salina TaxID=3046 RepID=A0ABQ7GBY2_DUNSA|nr:hypothetical protein DUNSADRAFT_12154 [Dunaliella salina]|eukprot:KAF5832105.1 hypothetical protein DUNSADRAFT_12154 [Dunaliella salina]
MPTPPDRPVYVGNFEYEAEEWEIRKLMEKYGDVERIDMKQGYAFVYMRDEEDGEYAIKKLDGMEWGYKKRPLRLQWSKMREADRQRHVRPTTTLFVVNFDAARTRTRDLERLFEKYGPLRRVEIKRNYAFVQYDTVDDAAYALKKTNATVLLGRTITVEFCQNEVGRWVLSEF